MSDNQPETAQIPVYQCDGTVRCYATVDASDEAFALQWRWYLSHRYAARGVKGHTVYLHRELMGLPQRKESHQEVDHINGNGLDNRRANLRVVPQAHNQQNKPSYPGSSRYRGVHWNRRLQCWVACAGRRAIHLGLYADELDAAKVAARWRVAHYPGTVEDPALLDGDTPAPLPSRHRGERIGSAKLNQMIVREARARYAAGGINLTQLAKEYQIGRSAMGNAVRGITWAHVA